VMEEQMWDYKLGKYQEYVDQQTAGRTTADLMLSASVGGKNINERTVATPEIPKEMKEKWMRELASYIAIKRTLIEYYGVPAKDLDGISPQGLANIMNAFANADKTGLSAYRRYSIEMYKQLSDMVVGGVSFIGNDIIDIGLWLTDIAKNGITPGGVISGILMIGPLSYGVAKGTTKAFVIGEGMDYVKAAAKELKEQGIDAKWYRAWKKNFPKDEFGRSIPMTASQLEAAQARNARVIIDKIKKGYDIYDIGPDGRLFSPFYKDTEVRILKEFNYPTIPYPRPKL